MAAVVVACAAASCSLGGMRSLTWSSVAKAIAALLALAVPASIVALMVSNLPLPQMTHGNVVRLLTRMEIAQGVPVVLAPPLAFDLPGEGAEPLIKRFIQSFGSVGSLSFVLMSFVVAAGIAASPALLSAGGHDARRLRGAQVAGLGGAGRRASCCSRCRPSPSTCAR